MSNVNLNIGGGAKTVWVPFVLSDNNLLIETSSYKEKTDISHLNRLD